MRKNAREQAIDNVILHLEKKLGEVNSKIFTNRFQFKKLTDEQTVLKRERAELGQLIRDLHKKTGNLKK